LIKFTLRALLLSIRLPFNEFLLTEKRAAALIVASLLTTEAFRVVCCSFLRRALARMDLIDAIKVYLGGAFMVFCGLTVVYIFFPRPEDTSHIYLWTLIQSAALTSRVPYERILLVAKLLASKVLLLLRRMHPKPRAALLTTESVEKALLRREYQTIINRHR
jgi:hypothetical protein